jgi:hypothetical protein
MRKFTLVDTLSFNKNRLYDTWVRNFDNKSYAQYHFLVKYNGQKIKINDVRFTRVGVQSDHLTIELNMKIKTWRPSKQGRKNKNITKTKNTKINYKVLKENPEKKEAFDEAITRFVIEQNPSYPYLAEHIVEQYKKITIRNIDEIQDWFQENKTSLLKHTKERNNAQYELTKKTTKENREELRGRRKALKKEKRKAKRRWQNKLARGCKDEYFVMAPKEARKVCREIEKGFTGHLPKITPPQFAKPNGLNATSADENADILKNHFQAVFDRRDVTTDETVIDKIEELDIDGYLKEELRSIPEIEEVKKAIKKRTQEPAPGIMGLTSDMLKALPEKSTGALDLENQEILERRRGSQSMAHHASDGLIQGKIQDQ